MNTLKTHKVQLIETIILLILFFIKALVYNYLTENSNVNLRLSIISLGYIIFVISLVNFFTVKKRSITLLIIYSIISIIMFTDAAYFKYFNQLTSVVVLRQITQVGTIGESITHVLRPMNFLLVADVMPLTIYYLYRRKFKPIKNLFSLGKKQAFGAFAVTLLLVVSSVFMVNALDDDINLFKQEFFTYHISDIYNIFFAKNEVDDMDEFIKETMEKTTYKDKNLYGVAKGKNVITIQVEGLQNFVIDREYNGQELTPNLNKLIKRDSIYFDRYYQQLGRGNTSDAEFVSHNSLYPAMDGQTYLLYYGNTFYGLPWILKDNGYSTTAFHGYKPSFWNRDKAYPYQGFDRFISEEDYTATEPLIGLGINDSEFFKQSVDYIKNTEKPYYAFLVTLSSHHPFTLPDQYKQIQLMDKHKDTLFGNYIQSINYVDVAIGEFIEDLKNEGLYEDTIINIYGDHFGLASIDEANKRIMAEYLGYDYDFDEMMRIPLIIHIPKSGINQRVSTTGAQIDFLPTLLNLLGIENKKGIMLGQDLINTTEGFAAQQAYMLKGSYIKNDVVFSMSKDGIYMHSRAWNPNTREPVELDKCKEDYERAVDDINRSSYILKNDLLKKYIKDKKELANED